MGTDHELFGVRKEAPFGVGEGSTASEEKEQQANFPAHLEEQHYAKLIAGFMQQVTCWYEILAIPEYLTRYIERDITWLGERKAYWVTLVQSQSGLQARKWGEPIKNTADEIPLIHIAYGYFIDKRMYDSGRIRVDFMFLRPSPLHEVTSPLLDPYTDTPVSSVDITLEKYPNRDHPVHAKHDMYLLDIKTGDAGVRYKSVGTNIYVEPVSEPKALLTDDHATALFGLMDSLISQVQPQLPKPATPGEK